ncbi:unnamed protein product [Staurois parvus]|uniref:Uncharacterized protein n=1 Tax=Staurois parvus TaxID=386267 RepID=A0ABN9HBG7_9NEOB|nr:unnamed protein product [Staurois parvus]
MLLFTYRPLPCQCFLPIARCQWSIFGRDPVIDSCSHQWQRLWPISDHMQSSKQDVTCDIITYYV